MTDDSETPPADREAPVGRAVVRGDEGVTGDHAERAVSFDPDDPADAERAAETVATFASEIERDPDNVFVLRGAAACAALVRAEGSYTDAAERAGADVGIPFVRKWARVHDLPRAVRMEVARGRITPTAAKHVARTTGDARFLIAWAIVDGDLTVREVRRVVSSVADGTHVEAALREQGIVPGEIELTLPLDAYRELRRATAEEGTEPETIVARALRAQVGEATTPDSG